MWRVQIFRNSKTVTQNFTSIKETIPIFIKNALGDTRIQKPFYWMVSKDGELESWGTSEQWEQ